MECKSHSHLKSIIPKVRRIIVIGDIHGDLNILIKCLQKTKVIDNKLQWIGKDTHVVQLGDQLDSFRGFKNPNEEPNDIRIVHFMTQLNEFAVKHGGAVYSILGNHEIMNVIGDFRYTSVVNIRAFYGGKNFMTSLNKRKLFFGRGGKFAKYLSSFITIELSCLRE